MAQRLTPREPAACIWLDCEQQPVEGTVQVDVGVCELHGGNEPWARTEVTQ